MVKHTEITVHTAAPVAMDVQALMAVAVEKGAEGVELLERLMDLRDREVARLAEEAIGSALWEFKRRCPPIPRDKRGIGFKGDEGIRQYVWYAPLETIQAVVDPILSDLGLWYSWSSEATERSVVTTCTLSHVQGASRTATMVLPVSGPPQSTATQAHAGTRSFAKRLTLGDVLGITTSDDVDGADGDARDPISAEQLAQLRDLVLKKDVDIDRVLEVLGVGSLDQCPASLFEATMRTLAKKPDKEAS